MQVETIKKYTYSSINAGPALLFFGAVHGNEICGPYAMERLRAKLDAGKITITKGSVTFIPICNPRAYAKGVRFIEENLNRIFKPATRASSYEAHLANVLCREIDACNVFLDIHSMTSNGNPFIFLDFPNHTNTAFAQTLGPTLAVTGWPELYAREDTEFRSNDTTAYAHEKGKAGLLIECGSHNEKKAISIAEKAMLHTMQHWGVIAGRPTKHQLKFVTMDRVYFSKGKDHMSSTWKHLNTVKSGQVLFTDSSGINVRAPYDGHIIMPKPSAPVGEALFYLGKRK